MYNPNNIVIGGALIFLVAYAFFIVRRMYKRRIQVLEQKNIQLEKALKTISLNLNPEPFEPEQNVVLEFPFMNGNMNNQMANMSNEEVEEVEELSNEGLSTIPEVQEEEISLSEQNTDIEKQIAIEEEPIEKVELIGEGKYDEVEEKSVSNDASESEKDLGISKDDINSMTVAQLKEKLAEIGTPVTKGMKKKELRAILLAL